MPLSLANSPPKPEEPNLVGRAEVAIFPRVAGAGKQAPFKDSKH